MTDQPNKQNGVKTMSTEPELVPGTDPLEAVLEVPERYARLFTLAAAQLVSIRSDQLAELRDADLSEILATKPSEREPLLAAWASAHAPQALAAACRLFLEAEAFDPETNAGSVAVRGPLIVLGGVLEVLASNVAAAYLAQALSVSPVTEASVTLVQLSAATVMWASEEAKPFSNAVINPQNSTEVEGGEEER